MIKIQNLSKSYQVGKQTFKAITDVNLDIKQGEIFGIIGQSGAGKSTLIKCVNLLTAPSAGDVIIDGKSTAGMKENQLRVMRQGMGKIFQHFNLLRSRTVAENIALPLEIAGVSKADIQAKIIELLSLVKLTEHKDKYPSQLSGGQKQRVAIARALATNPKIILSDEATSALDPTSTEDILNLLRGINQKLGITIFLITHEMDVVKSICHNVAVMHNGEIVEQCPVIDLFTNPKHEITKNLVKKIAMLEVPPHIKSMLQKYAQPDASRILRLAYQGDKASQPIMSYLIQQYRVIINILQGYIENVQGQSIGVMIVEIRGDEENLDSSIQFLKRNGLHVEILGYVNPNR
jgi:D-methionine transport system ATP-binding protein